MSLLFTMYFVLCSVLALARAYPQDVDPNLLKTVFGTPGNPVPPGTRPEDIEVRPTETISTFQNENGESCQCVPYYLCDKSLVAVNLEDPAYNGYGTLDIRFGESKKCQEALEKCCTKPVKQDMVPLPEPDPSRLKGCGFRNPRGLDFTIKPEFNEAQFGEFPWVVAILDAFNGTYYGVGVLIHPEVVLTGAHIVFKKSPGTLKIRAGEWDTQSTKERLQHQERIVADSIWRGDFNEFNLWNDVALLKLKEPVKLSDHINVACLPPQGDNSEAHTDCVANGWGKNLFGRRGSYAVFLKKVELNMVSRQRCQAQLQKTRLGGKFQLHDSFVCAGGEQDKDTCQGDGGAPLSCPVGNNRYKTTGLVAWGIGCGQDGVPAVYVDVAKFRGWIDTIMKDWGFDTSGYTL